MDARKDGDQYRSAQLAKNTVYVDIADGTATTSSDDHLREAAEARVHYVPRGDGGWMPKPVRGATVRCTIPAWMV